MYMWWLRLGGPAPQIFQNLRGADSWESRRNPAAAFAVHVRSGNLDGNMYMWWQRLGGPAPQIFQHLRGADSWESRRNPAAASIVHICSGGIYMRNVSVPGKAWPHGARSAPTGGGLGGPGYPSSSVLEGVGRALRIPIYMAHILGAGASKNCLGSRDRVICNEFCEVRSPWVH